MAGYHRRLSCTMRYCHLRTSQPPTQGSGRMLPVCLIPPRGVVLNSKYDVGDGMSMHIILLPRACVLRRINLEDKVM
jgi:hypothetical protein